MRIRDWGIEIGTLPTGRLNKISDVPGVTVGHCTVTEDGHNTGVTVVIPCRENPFTHKLPCASFVMNGFGKTLGLVQVDELGTLETPIALTSTLNVGLIHDAVVDYMIRRCADEGVKVVSLNPVVCECNDGYLNDASQRPVKAEHFYRAVTDAKENFEEGAVGSGRGMSCHGLKGGIGSASRLLQVDGKDYTLGILVLSNYGRLSDLRIDGKPMGKIINEKMQVNNQTTVQEPPDKGSCIMILATDLPLSDRQLHRTVKRCSVGLARMGSYVGHGSGEVFIGFSTANPVTSARKDTIYNGCFFSEDGMDLCFRAAGECAEEAILNSMVCAEPVTGLKGHHRNSLKDYMELL